jgi:hypothetical protein
MDNLGLATTIAARADGLDETNRRGRLDLTEIDLRMYAPDLHGLFLAAVEAAVPETVARAKALILSTALEVQLRTHEQAVIAGVLAALPACEVAE